MTEPDWNPYDRNCPTRRLLDRIGDRWTVLIIGALTDGRTRYSQLNDRVDGISQKMLTQTLRGLERDGLVHRTVYSTIPPRVEYELTELGRTLEAPLLALEHWATAHMAAVLMARADYDERATSRADEADEHGDPRFPHDRRASIPEVSNGLPRG